MKVYLVFRNYDMNDFINAYGDQAPMVHDLCEIFCDRHNAEVCIEEENRRCAENEKMYGCDTEWYTIEEWEVK